VEPMSLPLVIAHHLLSTAYGWWLPNDLRGSTSTCIASDVIAELGQLHFGRKKIQPASWAIRKFYHDAKTLLRYPLLTFTSEDVEIIGSAFARVVANERYTCYACVIMPDHVHLANRKHKHTAEEMIRNFQDASRDALRAAGRRSADHPVWAQGGWKVFLDSPDDVRRTIGYIDDNPTKMRLPKQSWPFVTPYDGRPLHPGHDPNSPYARRLRGYDGRR
jgi:REP element-mobilizing transposase RayT